MRMLNSTNLFLRKSLYIYIYIYIYVMFVSTTNAQIMYNKVKPVSLESQTFKQIQDLPIIDFPVEENGSMMQSNLNLIVKNKAIFESANDKNIARMMIKVNAQSLGNITVSFKDVLLDNNSYCLVYTQDHQIVAGPIYQKSINNNKFTIMNIPASELILEVIYKSKNDFTLKLDEVSFSSLVNVKEIKKKKQNQLLSNCGNSGFFDYYNNIDPLKKIIECNPLSSYENYPGCVWMGANNQQQQDLQNLTSLYAINDIGFTDFSSSRSDCILMIKGGPCPVDTAYPNHLRFSAANAYLINMPDTNCNNSYIMMTPHTIDTKFIIDNGNINYTAQSEAVVRFNWHYKYGTPSHLFSTICKDNTTNFNLWRSTIDFDEVVDYEGVELFTYSPYGEYDFAIFKMLCKPFYKESHLGWTKQTKFSSEFIYVNEYLNEPLIQNVVRKKELADNTFIVGTRGGFSPNTIFKNYFVFSDNYVATKRSDYYSGFNYAGFSGSMIIFKNYNYNNTEVAYTRANSGNPNALTNHGYFNSLGNFKQYIDESPSYPPTGYTSLHHYFTANSFYSLFNYGTAPIYYYEDNDSTLQEIHHFYWYPSMNNKERCPSIETPENPCDFDIDDYLTVEKVGNEICFTISSIPGNKFPSSILPKGFRIFHNFGEQRTIDWDPFQDGLDVSFPIEFCISLCEQLDMMSIGRDGVQIAIDFYDEDGNVYNNMGCDSVLIDYELPTFCELFDVDIQKIDSTGPCCTYEIELTIDYDLELLDDCPGNPNIEKLLDSIYFTTSMDEAPLKLSERDNYSIDLENGIITFEYTPCPDSVPTNTSFNFMISNNGTICEIESIDFPSCECACPENVNDWVTITSAKNEAPCSEEECRVDIKIDIPSLEGECYKFYQLNDHPILQPIPPNGIISYTPPCIYKGESKQIDIRLFKHGLDTVPCLITKNIICPYVDLNDLCEDSCYVKWTIAEYPVIMDLPGCDPDCKIKIDFAYRSQLCTNSQVPTFEIQILKLESFSTNPSNPDACAFCNFSDAQLYKLALLEIIYQNPMSYQPLKGANSCYDYWRVFNKSCWTRITLPQFGTVENPTPNFAIVPCKEATCCKVGLRVCRNTPNIVSIEVTEPWVGIDSCNNEYYKYNFRQEGSGFVYDSSLCNETCEDWINNLDTTGFISSKIIFSDENKVHIDDFYFDIIKNDDILELFISSNSEYNNSGIKIIDLQGKELHFESFKISKGTNRKILQTIKINTGIYFIQLNIGYTHSLCKKIIIVR